MQEPRLKEFKSGEMDRACNWPQSKVQGDFTSNERGNGGVATIVKKSFLETATNYLVNELAPCECQHVTFSIEGAQYSFANVYMDSRDGKRRGNLCETLQDLLPQVYGQASSSHSHLRQSMVYRQESSSHSHLRLPQWAKMYILESCQNWAAGHFNRLVLVRLFVFVTFDVHIMIHIQKFDIV